MPFVLADLNTDTVVAIAGRLPLTALARLLRTGKGLQKRIQQVFDDRLARATPEVAGLASDLIERLRAMPQYARAPTYVHVRSPRQTIVSYSEDPFIQHRWLVAVRTFPDRPLVHLDFRLVPSWIQSLQETRLIDHPSPVAVVVDSAQEGTLLRGQGAWVAQRTVYGTGLVDALVAERYVMA